MKREYEVKLKVGDVCNIKGLTEDQYHQVCKRFIDSGADNSYYNTTIAYERLNTYKYVEWYNSFNKSLVHTNFPEKGHTLYTYEQIMEEKQMIERNKEYDLKVTGEQLAWIYLIVGHTNGFWESKSKLFNAVEDILRPNTTSGTNIFSLDIDTGRLVRSTDVINSWLDNIFKAPETEKEKNLRELKEKHEELGKAIQKLEQSN